MDTRLGTFVVIEGTEASGKAVQCELLVERLRAEGHDVLLLDFPQYNQASSYFIREYLDGKYGSPDSISPYTTSLFYALDRYQAATAIRAALEAGKVVIANRFTGSSMAQQGVTFKHPEERRGYFIWLDNLEFQMLGIPRPDKSLVLRAQPEKDSFNVQITEVYDDLCNLFPRDFHRIDCARNDKPLSTEVIQNTIWNTVEPLLAPGKGKQGNLETLSNQKQAEPATEIAPFSLGGSHKYYVPDTLNEEVAILYRTSIDALILLRSQMLPKLAQHLAAASETPKQERDPSWQADISEQATTVLDALIPVAVVAGQNKTIIDDLTVKQPLPDSSLPMKGHSDDYTDSVRLARFSPRNELDLVPQILYQSSQLSMGEITQAVSKFTYAQKEETLLASISTNKDSDNEVLTGVTYSWDLLTSIKDHIIIMSPNLGRATKQSLSPRYGYDMPAVIEEAGLTDEFEKCFDLSLELHSLLQAKGYESEAQYATLLGHKMRWSLTHTANEAVSLAKAANNAVLVTKMCEKIAEVHPLIAKTILTTR